MALSETIRQNTVFAFSGLSTATKPVIAPDGNALTVGSTYRETDTTLVWLWNGTSWARIGHSTGSVGTDLTAVRHAIDAAPTRYELLLLRELRGIRTLLAQSQGISDSSFEPLPAMENLTTN